MPVPLEQPRVKTRLNKYATPGSPIIPSLIFPYFVLFYFYFIFFCLSFFFFPFTNKAPGWSGRGGGRDWIGGQAEGKISVARNWPMGKGTFFFFFLWGGEMGICPGTWRRKGWHTLPSRLYLALTCICQLEYIDITHVLFKWRKKSSFAQCFVSSLPFSLSSFFFFFSIFFN